MSDTIKVGDKVRHVDPIGGAFKERKVLGVYGELLWIEGDGRQPWTTDARNYVKVEPFFEAGKTYRPGRESQATFKVESIREDLDGESTPVAIGVNTYHEDGKSFWDVRRIFDGWEEVDDQ